MKANIFYHVLYGAQVLLGLAFQIQFARQFGASSVADAYFAGWVIVNFLSSIALFVSEMFLQYYNEARRRGQNHATELYQAVYSACLLIGGCIAIVSAIALPRTIDTLYGALDIEARLTLTRFSTMLVFSVVASSLVTLNSALLSGEFHFAITYWVGLLNPAANIVALLLFGERYGLLPLAITPTLAAGVGLVIQHTYMYRRLRLALQFHFRYPGLRRLLMRSFTMRSAQLLYMLKEPITASVLATLSPGSISSYYYGQRIMTILYTVITGPIVQVYTAKISRLVAERSLLEVRANLRKAQLSTAGMFVVFVLPGALLLPDVLAITFGTKFEEAQLRAIDQVFVALIPFFGILAFEQPYAVFVAVMKQVTGVLTANISFVLVFGALLFFLFVLRNGQHMLAIPAALAIAQFGNCLIYWALTRALVRTVESRS